MNSRWTTLGNDTWSFSLSCQSCPCSSLMLVNRILVVQILLLSLIVCSPSFFSLSLFSTRKPCSICLIACLKYLQLWNNSKLKMLPSVNLYLSFNMPHPRLPQSPHSTHRCHPKNPNMNPRLAFPIMFNGTRAWLHDFLNQIRLQPRRYAIGSHQVGLLGSLPWWKQHHHFWKIS